MDLFPALFPVQVSRSFLPFSISSQFSPFPFGQVFSGFAASRATNLREMGWFPQPWPQVNTTFLKARFSSSPPCLFPLSKPKFCIVSRLPPLVTGCRIGAKPNTPFFLCVNLFRCTRARYLPPENFLDHSSAHRTTCFFFFWKSLAPQLQFPAPAS